MATQIATELEQRLAALINAERVTAGLPEVRIEAHLNASAQAHSDWLAETENISLPHIGENGSTPTQRMEAAEFPLTGDVRTTENLAALSVTGTLDAGEADRMHEGLMESAGHRANILDPDVDYVGIGLSVAPITVGGGEQEVVFLTENFASTEAQVLVQDEVDGEPVLQPFQNGEPVGEPLPAETPSPEDPDAPEDPQDPDDETPEDPATASAGGCFVATAAYGSWKHPDVVALRRFRDEVLVRHATGRAFSRAYRRFGPKLARWVQPGRRSGRLARRVIAPLAGLARGYLRRRC